MSTIARWGDIKFQVTKKEAVLFENLKFSAGTETENKVTNGQQYVTRKNGKAAEMSLTIYFSAAMGINVKGEVKRLMAAAQQSKQAYFYLKGAKLFGFKLMLVNADTEETIIAPSGRMISAKVNVSFKQCDSAKLTKTKKSSSKKAGGSAGKDKMQNKSSVKNTTPAKSSGGTTNTPAQGDNGLPLVLDDPLNATNRTMREKGIAAIAPAEKTISTAKIIESTVKKADTQPQGKTPSARWNNYER